MTDEPSLAHSEIDFEVELSPVELEALGDLSGRAVLHLVAGLPVESLALAHLGARVLALDSGESGDVSVLIGLSDLGSELASEQDLDVTFIEHPLTELSDEQRDAQFDVVYAGPTTLAWLGNLHDWAVDVAEALVPGGRLVVFDEHPASRALEPADAVAPGDDPADYPPDEGAGVTVDQEWTVEDLVEALTANGLTVIRVEAFAGPQRFLTTAEAVGADADAPAAFLLVAMRPE